LIVGGALNLLRERGAACGIAAASVLAFHSASPAPGKDFGSVWSAAWRRLGFRIATTKAGQPTRALALDQRLQRLADKDGPFADAGERCGFGEESVIKGERGSDARNLASNDDYISASKELLPLSRAGC
jgi:hypothetical protein